MLEIGRSLQKTHSSHCWKTSQQNRWNLKSIRQIGSGCEYKCWNSTSGTDFFPCRWWNWLFSTVQTISFLVWIRQPYPEKEKCHNCKWGGSDGEEEVRGDCWAPRWWYPREGQKCTGCMLRMGCPDALLASLETAAKLSVASLGSSFLTICLCYIPKCQGIWTLIGLCSAEELSFKLFYLVHEHMRFKKLSMVAVVN